MPHNPRLHTGERPDPPNRVGSRSRFFSYPRVTLVLPAFKRLTSQMRRSFDSWENSCYKRPALGACAVPSLVLIPRRLAKKLVARAHLSV